MLVAFAGVPFLEVTLNFIASDPTPHSPCAHLEHSADRGKEGLRGCADCLGRCGEDIRPRGEPRRTWKRRATRWPSG